MFDKYLKRVVKGEIVLHWTCTQCTQNGEQQPDPAEHVHDQQADPGLIVNSSKNSHHILYT
jgi:hypothetical protein